MDIIIFFEITWTSSFYFFSVIHTPHNKFFLGLLSQHKILCTPNLHASFSGEQKNPMHFKKNLQDSWVFCGEQKILSTPNLHQSRLISGQSKSPSMPHYRHKLSS